MPKWVLKGRFLTFLGPGESPEMRFSIKKIRFPFQISHDAEKRGDDGSDRSPTSKNVATTVAIGVPRFFRGRRQGPQASQSADPEGVRRVGY